MSDEKLLVFVGTVGSGKSTQINVLSSKLESKGFKVKKSFLKTGHLFAYLLEVFLAKVCVREKSKTSPIRDLLSDKPSIFKRLFGIWILFDIFSIFLKFLVEVYIPLKLGYIVLVEEYIPAIIADYAYISKNLNLKYDTISFYLRFILKLGYLAGSTKVIYLDADTEALSSRWKMRGSRREIPKYLKMQRSLLLSFSKKISAEELVYVNTTNKTIAKTSEKISGELGLKETEK